MNFSITTIFSRIARSLGSLPIVAAMLIVSPLVVEASESNFKSDRLFVQVTGQRIEGEGISLVLPISFQGGDPNTELEAIEAQLSRVVADSSDRLAFVSNMTVPIVFLAFDSRLDSAGFLTNVNVVVESVPSAIGIEEYLNATTQALSGIYDIVEENIVTVNQISMGRVVAEQPHLKQLFYLIHRGDRFYVVTYSASSAEFANRLPMFERSIQTLRFER